MKIISRVEMGRKEKMATAADPFRPLFPPAHHDKTTANKQRTPTRQSALLKSTHLHPPGRDPQELLPPVLQQRHQHRWIPTLVALPAPAPVAAADVLKEKGGRVDA